MKVALVHDFLNQYGGAERVLESLKELYPEAPVYTSLYDPGRLPENMRKWKVLTPRFLKANRRIAKLFTFFYPLIFESFKLRNYNVIISSSSNFAKGVMTDHSQLHICYCHTPPRFLYHYETEVNRRKIWFLKPVLMFIDHYLRIWDYLAAQRVDCFVTNSKNVSRRIDKFYRRSSIVIYPPMNLVKEVGDKKRPDLSPYFLIVSRLARYKNVELAIRVCNELNLKLIVVGEGREEQRLKKISGEMITFSGLVSDEELSDMYANCQAVIFPGEDDFGIVPVEAMSYGKPVIAYGKGGALETVKPGVTGELFFESTVESLKEVLLNFQANKYDEQIISSHSRQFNKEIFKKKISIFVQKQWAERKNA